MPVFYRYLNSKVNFGNTQNIFGSQKLIILGVLRFFRVHLPRQFLNEASVISLIYAAEQEKISEKKEEKLRKEWLKAQDEKESPLKRLERENKRLQDRTIRLDFENDQVCSGSFPFMLRTDNLWLSLERK